MATFSQFQERRGEIVGTCGASELTDIIGEALNDQHQWELALEVLPYVLLEYRKRLFSRLLAIASSRHSLTGRFADAVLAFPKDWLKANIEAAADPLLASEEQYWQVFTIYKRLDSNLATKLRNRARRSSNPDIRSFADDSEDTEADRYR